MNNVPIIIGISFLTNSVLSLIKIITGILFKSGSLIADGIHSFSDLVTDIVAFIGHFISKKPADDKHPYGHGRIEYLTSLIIGIIILVLGFMVICNAWNRNIVTPSQIVIVVCGFTIISKLVLAMFLVNRGRSLKNNILISSGRESSMDVLSSLVVLISSILMQFSTKISMFEYADIIATIIVGIFIVKVGFSIIKENISILIGECENDEDTVNSLNSLIMNFDYVKRIDKITLLKYGSYYELTCEVSIDGNLSFFDAHHIVHEIEDKVRESNYKIEFITIHANPYID